MSRNSNYRCVTLEVVKANLLYVNLYIRSVYTPALSVCGDGKDRFSFKQAEKKNQGRIG